MDAVTIEHLFAGPLEIQIGKRGESNDADLVRSGKSEYLVKALEQSLKNLKKRVATLPANESSNILIGAAIGNLEMTKARIQRR